LKRRLSWCNTLADTASPCKSIIWIRLKCKRSWRVSKASKAALIFWSMMCGGADFLIEWNVPVWEHSLEKGLRMLRLAIDTHIVTSHFALPLLIKKPDGLVVEMTDGTAEYNNANY
jgi:hypothetical protein